MPEIDGNIDSEMESGSNNSGLYIDLDQYRKVVRTYIDLVGIFNIFFAFFFIVISQ